MTDSLETIAGETRVGYAMETVLIKLTEEYILAHKMPNAYVGRVDYLLKLQELYKFMEVQQ